MMLQVPPTLSAEHRYVAEIGWIAWLVLSFVAFILRAVFKYRREQMISIPSAPSRGEIHEIAGLSSAYCIVHVLWGITAPFTVITLGRLIPDNIAAYVKSLVPDHFLLATVFIGLAGYVVLAWLYRHYMRVNLGGILAPIDGGPSPHIQGGLTVKPNLLNHGQGSQAGQAKENVRVENDDNILDIGG